MNSKSIAEHFTPQAVAPDTAQVGASLRAMHLPLDIVEIRAIMAQTAAASGGPYISARAKTFPVPESGAQLRVVYPTSDPTAVCVVVHGGGWSFGAALDHDLEIEQLADQLGVVGVSVDYRLAPENPYPSPLDDVYAAIQFVLSAHPGGSLEFGDADFPVVVIAESAGANLALSSTLRMRDVGARLPDGLVLLYGAYDLSMTPSQTRFGDSGLVNSKTLPYFYTLYAGSEDVRQADISPLYADLTSLPQCLLTVGTDDPLIDDSLFLYTRMLAAGVDVSLHLAPGGSHGFNHFPVKIATAANARTADFVRDTKHGGL